VFLVDKNERRRRLLATALELEGIAPETETAEVESSETDEPGDNERVIMMSPKAARRFRIRPVD